MVRMQWAVGHVDHYEGERGAERLLRRERAGGDVLFYDGEQGAERMVRKQWAMGLPCRLLPRREGQTKSGCASGVP